MPSGTPVADILITTQILASLAQVAKNYQRIRWRSLRFIINGGASSLVSGSALAAFIRDASDSLGHDPRERVRAQPGAKTMKWWQNTVVAARPANDKLYTSVSASARLYSPGRFVLLSDLAPSAVSPLTVDCEWEVELSERSLEQEVEESIAAINTGLSSLEAIDSSDDGPPLGWWIGGPPAEIAALPPGTAFYTPTAVKGTATTSGGEHTLNGFLTGEGESVELIAAGTDATITRFPNAVGGWTFTGYPSKYLVLPGLLCPAVPVVQESDFRHALSGRLSLALKQRVSSLSGVWRTTSGGKAL